MRQLFGVWYALFLIGALAVLTMARVNDGGLFLLSFEGDAVHLAQVVQRMLLGQVPGRDFLTPLGAYAFLPVVWLMKAGFGLGPAFAYAPTFLGLACLPAVWWLGLTRLSLAAALAFGAGFLILLLSLLHGGAGATVTVSMYYNNWGWAVLMPVVLAALTPARGDGWVVALVTGAGLAFLALLKAPFAVFLLPAVILSLALARRWGELAGGVAVGLVVLVLATWPLGLFDYWRGYLSDLLFVAGSPVRSSPGRDIVGMAIMPGHVMLFLGWLGAALLLRQARRDAAALVFLALGAGFFAITQQNWQNDPHWALIFGLLLLVQARDVTLFNRYGWHLGHALRSVATGFLVLSAPGLYMLGQSLLVHSALGGAEFAPLFTDDRSVKIRYETRPLVKVPHPAVENTGNRAMLGGEPLPDCEKENGLADGLRATALALPGLVPVAGRSAIYADWVNALWLWSELSPLPGGAPWYYGGATGFEAADYLVVPLCPMGAGIRAMVLREVEAAGLVFEEVARDARVIVLERRR